MGHFSFILGTGSVTQAALQTRTVLSSAYPAYIPNAKIVTTMDLERLTARDRAALALTWSPRDFEEYLMITGSFYALRQPTTDTSADAAQPFVNPMPHRLTRETQARPTRYLMGVGNIYNYNDIVHNQIALTDDLWGTSDMSLLLAMWCRAAEQHLLWCIAQLEGDFAFVGTEHLDERTVAPRAVTAFAARDPWGKQKLYYTCNETIIAFSTTLQGLPQLADATQGEVPPGHAWLGTDLERVATPVFVDYTVYRPVTLPPTLVGTHAANVTEASERLRTSLLRAVGAHIEQGSSNYAFLMSGGAASTILLIAWLMTQQGAAARRITLFAHPGQAEKTHLVASLDVLTTLYPNITFAMHVMNAEFDDDLVPLLQAIQRLTPYVDTLISGLGLQALMTATCASDFLLQARSYKQVIQANELGFVLKTPFFDTAFMSAMLSLSAGLRTPQIYNNRLRPYYIVQKAFDVNQDMAAVLWAT